ncbi:MAG TPA: hypothetical protein PJ982_07535, partial [Lacipirellulaceae bacterium]|nr:hypothetical protein [Lacipirellulaceae bacterium]
QQPDPPFLEKDVADAAEGRGGQGAGGRPDFGRAGAVEPPPAARGGEGPVLRDGLAAIAREPQGGLAVLVRPGTAQCYRLAWRFDEQAVVAPRPHVTPLLDYLQGDERFYVLAAGQKDVRLLAGTKHSIHEVEAPELPTNLVDALNIDEYVQSIQFHTSGPGGRENINSGGGMFHGHTGGDQKDRKQDIVGFFRRLNDALCQHLNGESAPLVFAGVDYLYPLYRDVNRYPALLATPVCGNPERWRADQLHDPAWQLVSHRAEERRRQALEEYATLAPRRQATDILSDIVPAAVAGRIATLLIRRGASEPGAVDEASGRLQPAAADHPAEDLLNFAAIHAELTGGETLVLDKAEMPTGAAAAAIYRF